MPLSLASHLWQGPVVRTFGVQASNPKGARILAYAMHSDKALVGKRRTRSGHPFNLFPLRGGIQHTRKPSNVCRLGYVPAVQSRDLGIPDTHDKRNTKERDL